MEDGSWGGRGDDGTGAGHNHYMALSVFLLVCVVISPEFSFNRDGKPHSQPLLLPFIYFANITMEPKASGMMSFRNSLPVHTL